MGRLTSQADPLGNTTAYEYDPANNRRAVVNPYLKRFEYGYDAHNNLVSAKDPYEKSVLTQYNTDNLPVKVTDQEGKETFYEYDNEGRLLSTTDGNGNKVRMEYTENAGQQCVSCGEGGRGVSPSAIVYPTFRKELKYDARGRKVEEKDILGPGLENEYITTFGYDPAGNLSWVRDKEGKLTAYEYDELNRLEKVTDPEGNVTRYVYDVRGNLRFLTDAKNQTTEFRYDRANRLVKEIRPMGQEVNYSYDGAGNLVRKTDAKGQKTEYGYDEAGWLTGTSYYHAAGDPTPVKTVTFAYDNLGNLTSYDDGTTSGTYQYDDLSRKLLEMVNYGPFAKTIGYEYYANGTKRSFTGPDGTTYAYTYDPNNQVSSINIPGVGQITYNTYQWTRPTLMTLPGGTRKEMSYDALMRTNTLVAKDPGGNSVLSYQYGYDRMDNIVNKATEHGSYTYGYDSLYRLAGAVSPVLPQENYTYDPVGNRLTSSNASDWSYNSNNELQSYNGVSFQYDLNGNTSQKTEAGGQRTDYSYDESDRLTEVKDDTGAVIATYYYDPFGRRLWKDVGGTRTYFMYADEGLVAEFDGSGAQAKSYGYAPNSTWTTNPLFMKQAAQYYFYHNDHLGTPQKMTSVNGSVVWSTKYESFGNAEVDLASTIANNLRFPGQYYDLETGLHYNYRRYYDHTIARYLAVDPLGFHGGMNFFIYVNNNPPNLLDPFGLFCHIEWTESIGPTLYRWVDRQEIGYWDARLRSISWQLIKLRYRLLKKKLPPIDPNLEKKMLSKYRVRYTILERQFKAIDYWEVCYDDCTGEQLSKNFLYKAVSRETQDVILAAHEVDKYLGDPNEYNRREVDSTTITP
jgi:RHS repeat-associated protein